MGDANDFTYRYQEAEGKYRLQSWGLAWGLGGGQDAPTGGILIQRPEWLVKIVDVARIARVIQHTKHPPPVAIIWFHTDENYQLTGFIDTVQEEL